MLPLPKSALIQNQSRITIRNKSENITNCHTSQAEVPYADKMQHEQNEKLKALQKAKSGNRKRTEKTINTTDKPKGKNTVNSIPLIDTRWLTTVRTIKETLLNAKTAKHAPRQMPSTQQTARTATETFDLDTFLKTVFPCNCNTAPPVKCVVDFEVSVIKHNIYGMRSPINILHEYYTPKSAKTQVSLDKITFFVNYDHFYVNIIMSTCATERIFCFTILNYSPDIAGRPNPKTPDIASASFPANCTDG